MASCPRCGREMDYYGEYGQWYCNNCRSYHQPGPARAPSPPPPPAPVRRSKTGRVMIAVAVLAIIIILSGILYVMVEFNSTSDDDEDKITMNMDELRSDYDDSSGTHVEFKSLSPGDTVVVKDEIVYIVSDWDEDYNDEVTYIWLESAHETEDRSDWYDPWDDEYYDYDLVFEGDMTDEFEEGDEISVTMHVQKVNYNGIDMEVLAEMWGGDDFIPLPVNIIKLLKPWPSDDDDMEITFPTIEVTLKDNGLNDTIRIKHLQGDPLDWSKYKMLITNNTNEYSTPMRQLSSLGLQTAGESVSIDSSIPGFDGINYEKGKSYQLEIYNLKENKRVFNRENLICE